MMRHSPRADQVVCRSITISADRTCALSTQASDVSPVKCLKQRGIYLLIAILAYFLAISFIQATITRCFKIQTNLKLQEEAWWSQFMIWGWAANQTLTRWANHPLSLRLEERKSCVSACNQLSHVKLLMWWTWRAQPDPITPSLKTQFRWRCNTQPFPTTTQTPSVPLKRLVIRPTSAV